MGVENIKVTRQRVENGWQMKAFYIGEVLYDIFPHQGKNGQPHKGNMKVTGFKDEAHEEAWVSCVQRNCDVRVIVKATKAE